MNIFITVYHVVRDVLTLPMKLLEKEKNKKLVQEVEEEQKRKEAGLQQEQGVSVSVDTPIITEEKPTDELQEMKKITFNYEVVKSFGQTIKSSFDAATESEVRAFLINEGYKIVSITAQKGINWNLEIGSKKMKTSELTFALTQLSTYLRAGIPLIDSVRILAKQTSNASKRKVYERIVYDLVTGDRKSVV